MLCKNYRNLYLDAFVAAMQCESLKQSLKHAGMDQTVEQNDVTAGSALLMCYDNFQRNGQEFGLKDGLDYNYRNIQKDSIRCFLLLVTIQMKKYIMENKDTPKDQVQKFLIKNLLLLIKGVSMYKNIDLHIMQISNQLVIIQKYAMPFLEKNDLKEDFHQAIEIINGHSKNLCGDRKIEDVQKMVLPNKPGINLSEEENCASMKEYETTVQELLAMDNSQWIEFETFRKNVVLPREQKNAPSTVPAAQNPDQIVEVKAKQSL